MDGFVQTAPEWRAMLLEADRLAASGAPADALALYRRVLDLAPDTIEACRGAAQCARQASDPAAALDWLDQAAALDPADLGVQLDRAVALQALQRDAAAVSAYQAVLDVQPDHVAARLGLGKLARRAGDRAACLAHFQAAAAAAPGNPWPQLDIGDECREQGRHEDAEAAYRRVLALAPQIVQAHRGLGHCARRRGDRLASLDHFQAAVALAGAEAGPWLEVADDLRELGRPAAAEDAYRQALHRAPDHPAALRGLAHCARLRGDQAEALAHATALARVLPADVGPQLERAEALRALGRLDEAEAVYTTLLAADGGQVAARLGLGKCARLRGRDEDALAHFTAATRVAPDSVWPWTDLGDQCRELGRLDAAEDAYHRVLLIDRARLQAWLGLGHCARQRGARRQALAHFQAAILAAPSQPGPQLEAALELRELGLLPQAEHLYGQVLTQVPGHAQAQLGLALCARRQGRRRDSLALLRAAAAADPGHAAVQLEIAADLRELGDLEGAAAICAALAARRPTDPEVQLGLGFCARARGERAAAAAHFRRAAERSPGHVGAWLELAFEQRDAGDTDAAIATATQVLRGRPYDLAALLSVGLSERAAGRHEAALQWFGRAVHAHPAQAVPLVELALEERFAGRQAHADALLVRALELDPRCVPALIRQAEHALMAFDAERALALYRAAAEAQPGQTALRLGVAEALAALGQVEAALEALAALEAEQGPLPAIRQKRLLLLRRDGDTPAALRLARETAERFPRNAAVWAEWVQAELLIGNDAAVEAALAAAPAGNRAEQGALLRARGWLAERRWQVAKAVGYLQDAAALLPEDAGIQHDLLRLQVLAMDVPAARVTLRQFCRLTAHVTRLQNKSLNVSQTHFGQIIDEYRLDSALRLAADIARLPDPLERARLFRQALRRRADSTALAVGLLVALRQGGALGRRAAGRRDAIPSVIAQFWDTAPPPPDVARLMQTWAAQNPQHRIVRFDDAAARAYLAQHLPPAVLRAYQQVREPAQQADIFRLAWLVTEGGVYADADDRCLAPLATIVPPDAELVLFQEELGTVANDFIAAAPGHPLLRQALDLAVAAINRGDSDVVWLSTGPGLLTRALGQWLPNWAESEVRLPDGAVVLDRHELFQAVATGCMTGYKKTTRHWSNSSFAARRSPAERPQRRAERASPV